MENMDIVPKWVLKVWPKIPQMPKNLSAQLVCPSPKFCISMKKGFIGHPKSVSSYVLGKPKVNSRYYLTSKLTFKLRNQRNWLNNMKILTDGSQRLKQN